MNKLPIIFFWNRHFFSLFPRWRIWTSTRLNHSAKITQLDRWNQDDQHQSMFCHCTTLSSILDFEFWTLAALHRENSFIGLGFTTSWAKITTRRPNFPWITGLKPSARKVCKESLSLKWVKEVASVWMLSLISKQGLGYESNFGSLESRQMPISTVQSQSINQSRLHCWN